MYRCSWLITFEIFQIFFGIEGWVGGSIVSKLFLDFFYIYKVPKLCLYTDSTVEIDILNTVVPVAHH